MLVSHVLPLCLFSFGKDVRYLSFDFSNMDETPGADYLTNIERIDAVWQQNDLTVVAEPKFHKGKMAETLL